MPLIDIRTTNFSSASWMATPDRASVAPTIHEDSPPEPNFAPPGKAFWMSFIALIVTMFLSAMDLTGVSIILPTLTQDLDGGDDFVWVGSAYSLASTAILPLTGGLADIFGRKPIMIICVVLFSLGSALAGAAQNMNMMIGARSKSFNFTQSPLQQLIRVCV